jgi:F-box and WD-40 domain protein CDC4
MQNRIPSVSLESGQVDTNELSEAIYNPDATRPTIPTSYRSHFKQQYLLNNAWASGGRLAAKYVINNQAVVTSLIMEGQYIVIALDNNKIHVFREDGKMLRSLFGHVMGVWALCLKGDTLVSGGCDRDVRVWDLKTGQCTQILRGHSSTVRCLQMVDDDTAVSGSRDATVRVWDVKRGICRHVLEGHMSSVRCLEVSGDICVSGSYDYTAKVWRISTGELLHTLAGHVGQIYSLAFDGKRVATGSLDATIRIWDPESGRCLSVLQGHTSLVSQIQMKDDVLVSGGSDGAVRVWDLATNQCLQRFAAHDNSVTCLQFGDDRIVTGGSDGWVQVWDLKTGQHVREMGGPFDAVWRVAFKDERVAILASRDSKIYMELTSFTPPEDHMRRPPDINPLPSASSSSSLVGDTLASQGDFRQHAPSPSRNSFETKDRMLNPHGHVDPHDASGMPRDTASPSHFHDHDNEMDLT